MFEQSKLHHPTCMTEVALAAVYVAIGIIFAHKLIQIAQNYFLFNEQVDPVDVFETVLAYGSTTFILSCLRTLHLHIENEFSWMSGFVVRNFILAMIVGLREVLRLFTSLLYNFHFEASIYYATGVMMVIGVLVGVGAGTSMIAAFSLTSSLFL